MLIRWNPRMNSQVENGDAQGSVSRVFAPFFSEPFFRDMAFPSLNASAATLLPAADIVENEEGLQLSVDLPGHDPKAISVKLEGEVLTISSERRQEKNARGETHHRAERSYGVFSRSFVLPRTVDPSRCEARYEHGVLTLTLPKREEARPRTIEIKVQS